MNISINAQSAPSNNSEALVLAVTAGKLHGSTHEVDKACGGLIQQLIKSGDISTQMAKCTTLLRPEGIKSKRLVLVGMGKVKSLDIRELGKVYDAAIKELATGVATNAAFYLHEHLAGLELEQHVRVGSQNLLDSAYRFEQLKSKKGEASKLKKACFSMPSSSAADKNKARRALEHSKALVKGMHVSKDLGNLPGNICTPSYLAQEATKLAKLAKVKVKVIDEKQFARMGMGAFLSVAKGSEQPAKLICIDYQGGRKEDRPHVLVGKGITFDTGGISLKPGAAMDEMKYDMCGAASVMGTLTAIISAKLKINVIGVIAAAENMPGSRASKPGDIVTSMSGLTIEILNTDAEGRLVLCDALTYVERFKPASVIDIATLTGACVVALGSHASALYSNNDKLAERIEKAGLKAWDRVWPMPLWPEYNEQLKSPFADLANIGGPKAGSITAACFLENFAKKYPWAHLDIAGTAWNGPGPNKGATGRPVPLLFEYISELAGK